MEQASGSFMIGIRAFSASSASRFSFILWPSTALRFFVNFQVNAGVSYLVMSQDIYDDGGPLCSCFNH